MKKLFILLLPILAVVGLMAQVSGSTDTAARTGAIVGIVTANGVAAPGVAVMIEVPLPGGRSYTARTHTDRAGRYGFRQVPAGHGTVRARSARGLHAEARFALNPGTVERVPLSLHR